MTVKSSFCLFHTVTVHAEKLLSDMYSLGMEKTAGEESILNCKIKQMAEEMDAMVGEHIRKTVESMTKSAESQCPNIFQNIDKELSQIVDNRSHLPNNYVRDHVIKQTGTEIKNRVSELNLVVATIISDKVTDTLLEALSQCNTTLTEKLNRQKQQRAQNIGNGMDKTKENTTAASPIGSDSESENEASKENEEPVKPDLLPAIRKERALSIAKRKQRPASSAVSDIDISKEESSVDKIESLAPTPETTATEENSIEKDDVKDQEEKTDKVESVYAKVNRESTIKKKDSVEIKEEEVKEKEDTKPEVDESPEVEMTATDGKSTESSDEDIKKEDKEEEIALPELSSPGSKKLEHITKGRVKAPRARRSRARPANREENKDESVDEFFSTNVETADFEKVPTLAEEKELAAKEKSENKKSARKMPGMGGGMPLITPDMLRKKSKKKEADDEEVNKEDTDVDKKENGEATETKEDNEEEVKSPSARRKPPGGMGMGFGGNVLAEMKLRKLNKPKTPEKVEDKKEEEKDDKSSPFGPRLLRKTKTPQSTEKDKVNNNNSNNSLKSPTSTPNRWKSKSLEKNSPKPDLTSTEKKPLASTKPTSHSPASNKAPLMPGKPRPLSMAPKPSSIKGKPPPPLPTKPKPTARKPGLFAAKQRPMSEFISADKVPSSVRSRVSSWGNKEKNEK